MLSSSPKMTGKETEYSGIEFPKSTKGRWNYPPSLSLPLSFSLSNSPTLALMCFSSSSSSSLHLPVSYSVSSSHLISHPLPSPSLHPSLLSRFFSTEAPLAFCLLRVISLTPLFALTACLSCCVDVIFERLTLCMLSRL